MFAVVGLTAVLRSKLSVSAWMECVVVKIVRFSMSEIRHG
jgi:hypothetical protein